MDIYSTLVSTPNYLLLSFLRSPRRSQHNKETNPNAEMRSLNKKKILEDLYFRVYSVNASGGFSFYKTDLEVCAFNFLALSRSRFRSFVRLFVSFFHLLIISFICSFIHLFTWN